MEIPGAQHDPLARYFSLPRTVTPHGEETPAVPRNYATLASRVRVAVLGRAALRVYGRQVACDGTTYDLLTVHIPAAAAHSGALSAATGWACAARRAAAVPVPHALLCGGTHGEEP